jgi:hypothetical protein
VAVGLFLELHEDVIGQLLCAETEPVVAQPFLTELLLPSSGSAMPPCSADAARGFHGVIFPVFR